MAPSQNSQRVACCNSAMGKELELQKACQNFDKATVKKLLQKYCKSGMVIFSKIIIFTLEYAKYKMDLRFLKMGAYPILMSLVEDKK